MFDTICKKGNRSEAYYTRRRRHRHAHRQKRKAWKEELRAQKLAEGNITENKPKLVKSVKWFVTEFYPAHKKGTAILMEQSIIPRLKEDGITIFIPLGPRYTWETRGLEVTNSDPEAKTLEYIKILYQEMIDNMPDKEINLLFLGADVYGYQINNLPKDKIALYFSNLEKLITSMFPEGQYSTAFKLWSSFSKVAKTFQDQAETILERIPQEIENRAKETAGKMKGGDHKAYLRERLVEAMVIENNYSPIKLSAAPPHKDYWVDYMLPRLYLIPIELQTPWLR